MTKINLVTDILNQMTVYLSGEQLQILKGCLDGAVIKYNIEPKETSLMVIDESWKSDLDAFLTTKEVEGHSGRTITLYKRHLTKFLSYYNKATMKITSDDVFSYFQLYKRTRKVSNVYMENIRLVFSSFFSWLHANEIISKNPMKSIGRFKVIKKIKKPLTEEERVQLNRHATHMRDLALLEFLYSTGIRVGELCQLNISDVRFIDKELVVYGKGAKERTVYISSKASVYLKEYLNTRTDSNEALFVTLNKPHKRLSVAGVQYILKNIGKLAGVNNVHPHRFRRTMATTALNRGMPIQEVQLLLGHTKIDTTLIYCTINEENVRYSHKKYIA